MVVRTATLSDVQVWSELRHALWPSASIDEHRLELIATLQSATTDSIAFVATRGAEIDGFAEAALRRDYVNGCDTSPVAFLEGIYVRPKARRLGVGRALSAAVEAWGRQMGCTELASDALQDNAASHVFHGALGFEETERVVYFRKRI